MSALVAQPSWLELLTFSRRHAGVGFARRPGRIASATTREIAPSDIFPASERVGWWRADQGITLNATRVSDWQDMWNGELLRQTLASSQPLFDATGFLGKPCVTNDTGARRLNCDLLNLIPIGSRSYAFVFLQWIALGTTTFMFSCVQDGGATSFLAISAEASFRGYRKETGAVQDNTPTIVRDTSPHRHEVGYTTGGIAGFVTDATTANHSVSGTPAAQGNNVRLHSNQSGSSGPQAKCAEIIFVKAEPSAAQKAAVRAYGAARYVGL
jgi:hypothetical protein